MVRNYSPTSVDSVYALAKFYKERNKSTAYILPMVGLSSFDFLGHLVDTYISFDCRSVHVKSKNPMFSLADHKQFKHAIWTSNIQGQPEFYYLEFEIPERFHIYYDRFKEGKLNQLNDVCTELLLKNRLIYDAGNGINKFAVPSNTNTKEDKLRLETIEEMIYSIWDNFYKAKDSEQTFYLPLYERRLQMLKDLEIDINKEEFERQLLAKEIDLSQKMDIHKLNIENELKQFKFIETYDYYPQYI